MSEIKVSVVVPAYNVEKYIKKSLDSILNQTLRELEIICVNDGSTDNTKKILEEYAEKDNRIKIINKENGGLSSARNVGMQVAIGEYLGFVDSDDWIEPQMYEKLYEKAKADNSEMVICSVYKYDDKAKQVVNDDKYYTLGYFPDEYFKSPFNHNETKDFLLQIPVMAWNKIYKRDFIEQKGAQFPEGFIFEDGPFFFLIYFDMKRVSLVREQLYYYRVNRPHSIIDKGGKNYVDIIHITELLYKEMVKLPYYEKIRNYFFKEKFNDALYRYRTMNKKYKKHFYEKMKDFYSNIELQNFEQDYPYSNFILDKIKNNDYKGFEKETFNIKVKDKIMSILYSTPDFYTIKLYGFMMKIKKCPPILDMWYKDNFIQVKLFNKKTFNIKFSHRIFQPEEQ